MNYKIMMKFVEKMTVIFRRKSLIRWNITCL